MLSAESMRAFEESIKQSKELVKAELLTIEASIKTAIKSGNNNLVYRRISPEAIEAMRELGYTVEGNILSYYIIRWR